MAIDALTQKDIDSLLQGAAPAAPRAQRVEVVPYNFLRPPRISKERRVILEAIYTRFAGSLQGMLSTRLREPTDVSCSVEQATYAEFLLSLATPCAAYTFTLGPTLSGQGVLDFSIDVGFHTIDRLFGGTGEGVPPGRPLTALERTVLKGMAERILLLLQEVWADHIAFDPEVVGFESAPETIQVANQEENVLVANVEVRVASFSGLMICCLPLAALESFLGEKNSATLRFTPRGVLPQQQAALADRIRGARVDVAARFPVFRLRARDVAALRVGQVLQTGHSIDVPIEISVNSQRRFVGELGQSRRAVGVRITQVHPRGTMAAEGDRFAKRSSS